LTSLVTLKALRLVPAGQVESGTQAEAFAGAQVAPSAQAAQERSAVAEHAAAGALPAAQAGAQALQGAKPVADHEAPATQGAFATHCIAVAFQTKLGALQAQEAWPVSAALALAVVLYSGVVGHTRHAASPAAEKLPTPHAAQAVLLVKVQAAASTVPAAQLEQLAQGT